MTLRSSNNLTQVIVTMRTTSAVVEESAHGEGKATKSASSSHFLRAKENYSTLLVEVTHSSGNSNDLLSARCENSDSIGVRGGH